MGALSKNTTAAQLRREVEEKTGAIANMAQFGFRPLKYALTGEVTRWTSLPKGNPQGSEQWIVQRTARQQWRCIYCSGLMIPVKQGGYREGNRVLKETRLGDGLTFPGPCAAAMWLEVEKSNGNGTR